MMILDEPYASSLLLGWAAETEHPLLENDFTRALAAEGHELNLVSDAEAARRIDAGERVYTNSENALAWILAMTSNEALKSTIRLFKDKAAMRRALASLAEGFFYAAYSRDELAQVDPCALPLPVVLKPAVGFCSMGVYTISSAEEWQAALADIDAAEAVWASRYPGSVVDAGEFVVEAFLQGVEYAVDMYYDVGGHARLLNVMRHDFAGPDDTSDRLYNTSHDIIMEVSDAIVRWLDAANEIVGARDFPAHVELRIMDDGSIVPIEFNPLRFAGLSGTDLAYHAWGVRTYAAYLEGEPVDLAALSAPLADKTFTMSLLGPHPSADLTRPFLYDALAARFSHVLGFHRFDVTKVGSYGFLFLETDERTSDELEFLLHSDLLEFVGESDDDGR